MAGNNYVVSVDKFEAAMKMALGEIVKVTDEAQRKAVQTTATQVKKNAQSNAPVLTGDYKRHWSQTEDDKGYLRAHRTVYVRSPEYRLTHLLQNGHRGPHPARAFPHIPQDDETEELFIKNLRTEIEK